MGKGKDAGEDCGKCCAFCGICGCFCLIFIIALGFVLGISIAKIVMGALYKDECDIEPMIPIYLIVSGVAILLFGGTTKQNSSTDEDQSPNIGGIICGIIGFIFNLIWNILGSVWTYPNYGTIMADDFTPCTGNATENCSLTCDTTLIRFSFAMVTIDWVFMGLWTVSLGCFILNLCGVRCFNRNE